MTPIRWLRRASEYAIGVALVLAHLALAGRGRGGLVGTLDGLR